MAEKMTMKEIIQHLKEMGFIFQGSEIYGGLANSWDYGPLGVLLKQKIKTAWWKHFIKNSIYNVGLDSSIFLNSKVWGASGHLDNFNDPLIDCKTCKSRFRADNLINHYHEDIQCDGWDNAKLEAFINEKKLLCLNCGEFNFTKVRQFQLMFGTNQGSIQNKNSQLYLRPETAQGIFINFPNIHRYYNKKLPFGIGQIGKSFRNEITPGNFIFRTLEFEQMELEFFFSPEKKIDWFKYYVDESVKFLTNIGLAKNNLILKPHSKEELAHYSVATTDIEYIFPFGQKELCGIANRGSFDLEAHQKASGTKMTVEDPETKKLVVPHVIEPSFGVERLLLALICDALVKETNGEKTRTVLKLHPSVTPYQVVITSLNKKKLGEVAKKIFDSLALTDLDVFYDERSSIGKVYNHHDSIGTMFCVTVDYETVEKKEVTVRYRDSMKQEKVALAILSDWLKKALTV